MIPAIIADDEPAATVVIQYLIEKSNMPIKIVGNATDGQMALNMIRSERPELVFLDIQMPLLNGFELISQEPHLKYIIITAYESFHYAQQALRMGAKDILLKPVEYDTFCNSVSRAIGWKFTTNDMTNNIIEYIQKNYAQHIEVNQLAKIYYTTASHIARVFKKNMGVNVIAYLHSIRIMNAIEMLENTDMGIKEISEACGYENLNNFYRHFKQATGYTPATYRERNLHISVANNVEFSSHT
mgnify:CR=1 FL=1